MPSDPFVQYKDHDDGSADFTITFAEDDHRFSALAEGSTAVVEYEETLSWRGKVRVSEPDQAVYSDLMRSDEMTEFLDEYDLDGVKRKHNP